VSDQIRDSLDTAIDRVATRLVSIADDPDAAQRIVASLPVRREHPWWSWSSWPLQAAALASVLLAIGYLRLTSDEVRFRSDTARPDAMLFARPMDAVAELRPTALRVEIAERTTSSPRALALARVSDSTAPVGQSFGLALIVAPDSLSLPTLQTTAPLATIEPATVAPISLTDLPLTTEAPPPFSKE
jgi:hypothetical protein